MFEQGPIITIFGMRFRKLDDVPAWLWRIMGIFFLLLALLFLSTPLGNLRQRSRMKALSGGVQKVEVDESDDVSINGTPWVSVDLEIEGRNYFIRSTALGNGGKEATEALVSGLKGKRVEFHYITPRDERWAREIVELTCGGREYVTLERALGSENDVENSAIGVFFTVISVAGLVLAHRKKKLVAREKLRIMTQWDQSRTAERNSVRRR